MARLRKGICYRKLERPFTRKSKYREKSFIKSIPPCQIVKFVSGDLSRRFDHVVTVRSRDNLQLRHNALEAGRKSALKLLTTKCGKSDFRFRVRPYPHHVLRENPLASGAGADRMSTGMKQSFGKSIGLAARIKSKQIVAEVFLPEQYVPVGLEAMKRFTNKLPGKYLIEVEKTAEAQ